MPVLDRICDDSFFASPSFARLWHEKGGRAVVWYLKSGEDIVAVLPGVEFGRLFYKRFMSMPDGCYGGVFCDPAYNSQKPELIQLLLDAVLNAGYLRTFIFDYYGDMGNDPRFKIQKLETTLVDISQPNWLPSDKKLRAQIRKAEREGIVLQDLDWGQHGDRFIQLMELTEKRHNQAPTYSRKFFKELSQAAKTDPRILWIWCEYEGQGACSHIYLIERGVLFGWQVYFDKEFSFLKPNQYIRFNTSRLMAERGIKYLNLGGSPENASGLSYFKNRWGGETYSYRGLVHRSRLDRLFGKKSI